MALSYKYAKEVYEDTLNEITQSSENWIKFLNLSTWMFEYTFGEQILIYAQRPNSRAYATMQDWNNKLYRWVKKGSKAITILKYEDGKSYLENIFDIADTYQRLGKEQGLWTLNISRDEKDYIEVLQSKYGEFAENLTIKDTIITSAINLVNDNIDSYLQEIKGRVSTEQNEIFMNILRDSIIYTVNNRLGIKNDEYLSKILFEKIELFSDPVITTILGTTCRELTRDILRETRTFVKNKNRTFDNSREKLYVENNKIIDEGREVNVTRNAIQRNIGLSNSTIRDRPQSSENGWQVRKSEGEIFAKTSDREIRILENDRTVNSAIERQKY